MTRGRENPACLLPKLVNAPIQLGCCIRTTVQGLELANPEAPAVKREAEEDWRAMRVIHSAPFELSVRCSSFLSQPEGHRSAERAASEVQKS